MIGLYERRGAGRRSRRERAQARRRRKGRGRRDRRSRRLARPFRFVYLRRRGVLRALHLLGICRYVSERKRVAVLGSTGSIGTQTLDVVARHPDGSGRRAGRGAQPRAAARAGRALRRGDRDDGAGRSRRADARGRGERRRHRLAATDGMVAFEAVFAAVERGIDVAVANKELIVAAGELLVAARASSGSRILRSTASTARSSSAWSARSRRASPRSCSPRRAARFGASRARRWSARTSRRARHPTWRMGTKNTVDSATMMNKGLEVIEASRLFGMPAERITIFVHPQSSRTDSSCSTTAA